MQVIYLGDILTVQPDPATQTGHTLKPDLGSVLKPATPTLLFIKKIVQKETYYLLYGFLLFDYKGHILLPITPTMSSKKRARLCWCLNYEKLSLKTNKH